jgi:hypothetical protein
MKQTRRAFLRNTALVATALSQTKLVLAAPNTPVSPYTPHKSPEKMVTNVASMVEADGKLRLDFGEERMVMDGGLQPFLLCTASGAYVVQAQSPNQPFPSTRMHYTYAMWTTVSRDGGKSWQDIPLKQGENGLNTEGGTIQLRDGTIMGLDTYVIPGAKPEQGVGQLYWSKDDWRTLHGPEDAHFDLPGIDFYASKDDGGHPHDAVRLHRRILELPNGDLLTTFYGCMKGDNTPSTYTPSMMKTRVILVRSSDRGRHWKLVSTVAVDPKVGTEGFDEPAIVRVSKGPQAGRLICWMRTGREMYEAISDDEGKSWSPARILTIGGLDINRTELWVDMFRNIKGRSGKLLDENNPDELKGAVVDPDLIELRSGLLVGAFGVRVPQKACWPHAQHPWNGNYLAISADHGKTWPNVVRLTSGVVTTHYMGVEETKRNNEIFVVYDYGFWRRPNRYSYGRHIQVTVKS